MGVLEVIGKQKLSTKNRIALVLLDSNFEIALKEFIVSRTDLFPPQPYPDTRIATIFKAKTPRHQRSEGARKPIADTAPEGFVLLQSAQ
jgi:hypothetical protein